MVVVEIFGEAEDDPGLEARIVNVGRAPALQRFDLRSGRCLVGGFAIEQRTAVGGERHLRIGGGSDASNQRMIFGGRLDVRAGFEQRQRAAADEVDLEPEEDVVGARLRDQGVHIGADAEERADEAAHVRRHRDNQVAARDRRRTIPGRRDTAPTAPTARAPCPSPARRSAAYRSRRRAGRCKSANVKPSRPSGCAGETSGAHAILQLYGDVGRS